MVIGQGSVERTLTSEDVRQLLATALEPLPLDGKKILVIIPDSTRTAPIPLIFYLLHDLIGRRVARLDYLVALGTHPPMDGEAIDRLVGVSAAERAEGYPKTRIFNHRWDLPDTLETVGVISGREMAALSGGLVEEETPVRLNRMVFDYDQLIICGPVFPHEVVGFSGGAKYLFPGIAGPEIINSTHWLGAMVTNVKTIGIKDTAVRRVIHRAAEFLSRPILCLSLVLQGSALHGLYAGSLVESWEAAAELSAQLNVVVVPHAFRKVLSMPSEMYDDLWTAAKAMYKVEPAVADGGEVIIYAPHITEVSYTHGRLLDEVGYHVLEYFTKQPERFREVPGGVKAHSTHVKGAGSYDPATGIETPRVSVTLATGIPEARCRRINLGYLDYRTIDPKAWAGREKEGILLLLHAGEMLFRARDLQF
ncbi:MAG: lactate racemase domain-containing protein [Sphingomonadaceae bacterium]